MNAFQILTPLAYWLLVGLWGYILWFLLQRLRLTHYKRSLLNMLIIILAIDALRTLVESIYFGTWYTAKSGLLPGGVYDFLVRPEIVILPKILNIVTAAVIIGILFYRWFPAEKRDRELQESIATERTHDLRTSEESFRRMIETLPLAIYFSSGIEQNLEYMNPAFISLFGYTAEDIPRAADWFKLAYPDPDYSKQVEAEWTEKIKRAIDEKSPIEPMETVVTCKNGSKRHMLWGYMPIREKNYAYGLDLTERNQAMLSLTRSEAKYRDLFEQSADAFLIIKDGRFMDCNQAAVAMMRCEDKAQLLNTHPGDLSPEKQPDGSPSQKKADELIRRMEKEKALRFEWIHKRIDGELFPVEVSLTAITDSEGAHIIHTAWRDITERKASEAKLRRLSTAIEQSPEMIVITDLDGVIQYANPSFEAVTGYSLDEAIGQKPSILKSGEQDAEFYEKMWQTISGGNTWGGRIVNKRKDGSLYTEEATISPVRDGNGQITNYVTVKHDISKEINREEELRQAQKMDAIGQLASGVAHDFNNILQAIQGFSELLLMSLESDSQEHRNADEIHKAAVQAATLTRRLLTFSRKQPSRLKEMELNHAVHDSEELLHVLLGETFELVFDLDEHLAPIVADQGQLSQVIINLAVNARDAMPNGGRLLISTRPVVFDQSDVVDLPNARAGSFACLSIKDSGDGMDAEIIKSIFEPFFTTKPVGRGTGLGLSVVYGIVKQCGGWINVQSEIGRGTTFTIYFPEVSPKELNSGNKPLNT